MGDEAETNDGKSAKSAVSVTNKRGDMWTASEDEAVLKGVQAHGFKWLLITETLAGRSINAVRNRYLRLAPQQHQQQHQQHQQHHHQLQQQHQHQQALTTPLMVPGMGMVSPALGLDHTAWACEGSTPTAQREPIHSPSTARPLTPADAAVPAPAAADDAARPEWRERGAALLLPRRWRLRARPLYAERAGNLLDALGKRIHGTAPRLARRHRRRRRHTATARRHRHRRRRD
eukprot:scaffold108635_cov60-Phaeocystis_antarctica.AAC.1